MIVSNKSKYAFINAILKNCFEIDKWILIYWEISRLES